MKKPQHLQFEDEEEDVEHQPVARGQRSKPYSFSTTESSMRWTTKVSLIGVQRWIVLPTGADDRFLLIIERPRRLTAVERDSYKKINNRPSPEIVNDYTLYELDAGRRTLRPCVYTSLGNQKGLQMASSFVKGQRQSGGISRDDISAQPRTELLGTVPSYSYSAYSEEPKTVPDETNPTEPVPFTILPLNTAQFNDQQLFAGVSEKALFWFDYRNYSWVTHCIKGDWGMESVTCVVKLGEIRRTLLGGHLPDKGFYVFDITEVPKIRRLNTVDMQWKTLKGACSVDAPIPGRLTSCGVFIKGSIYVWQFDTVSIKPPLPNAEGIVSLSIQTIGHLYKFNLDTLIWNRELTVEGLPKPFGAQWLLADKRTWLLFPTEVEDCFIYDFGLNKIWHAARFGKTFTGRAQVFCGLGDASRTSSTTTEPYLYVFGASTRADEICEVDNIWSVSGPLSRSQGASKGGGMEQWMLGGSSSAERNGCWDATESQDYDDHYSAGAPEGQQGRSLEGGKKTRGNLTRQKTIIATEEWARSLVKDQLENVFELVVKRIPLSALGISPENVKVKRPLRSVYRKQGFEFLDWCATHHQKRAEPKPFLAGLKRFPWGRPHLETFESREARLLGTVEGLQEFAFSKSMLKVVIRRQETKNRRATRDEWRARQLQESKLTQRTSTVAPSKFRSIRLPAAAHRLLRPPRRVKT